MAIFRGVPNFSPLTEDGGPAFPTDHSTNSSYAYITGGMSLRDWFAGQALTGIAKFADKIGNPMTFAESAYQLADAMLAARKATHE